MPLSLRCLGQDVLGTCYISRGPEPISVNIAYE